VEYGGGTLIASDTTPLAYQFWRPAEQAKAAVAYLHGVGGHSGQPTYRYFIDHLVAARHAVYGVDLRGHGRSGGRRGHVDRWREYLDDVSGFLAAVRQECPGTPLFLFGQSLGGLIALDYAIGAASGLEGVIASAPALAQPNVPRWAPPLLRVLARIAPTLAVDPKIDAGAFTRDRGEVAKLEADPLRFPKVTCRFFVEFEAAVARVQANAQCLQVPVLMVVGQADAVTPPKGTQDFFNRLSISDKSLRVYEGGYHQPILDTNRDEVLSDIQTWIHAHS